MPSFESSLNSSEELFANSTPHLELISSTPNHTTVSFNPPHLSPITRQVNPVMNRNKTQSANNSSRESNITVSAPNVEIVNNMRPTYQISAPFSGLDFEDVEEYLIRFERIADCNSWNPDQRKQHLPAFLRGAAESWHHSYHLTNPDCSWDEFKDSLRAAFPGGQKLVLQKNLFTKVQGSEETIPAYFHFMRYLCDRVDPNMAEATRADCIIRGLRQPYLSMVITANPRSCADLWAVLQRIHQAEIISDTRPTANGEPPQKRFCPNEFPVPLPPIQDTRHNRVEQVRILERSPIESTINRLCNRLERMETAFRRAAPNYSNERSFTRPNDPNNERQVNRYSRSEDGRPICFRCGRAGHYERFCSQTASNRPPTPMPERRMPENSNQRS